MVPLIIDHLAYILVFVVFLAISSFIYIRLKYGFWSIQPVFHVYDAFYLFSNPKIISSRLPEKNKYTNFEHISTMNAESVIESELKQTRLVKFICSQYLQNADNVFSPKLDNLLPYFKGHNFPAYFSFYEEKENEKDKQDKLIGTISSRPVLITFTKSGGSSGGSHEMMPAYYVDYLCVDSRFRKKGIAAQLIQTHEYNHRHLNPRIVVSLFKREDELTGIVPLCVYQTYGFSANQWTKPHAFANAAYNIVDIGPQNLHLLMDFVKQTSNQFEITVRPEIANIVELLKTNNIFICAVLFHDEIQCAYFYRKSCTFIEKNLEVLSCFASVNNGKCDVDVFVHGFKISFWKIAAKHKFGAAAIEHISHNHHIIDALQIHTTPFIVSPTAYFFYNFVHPTVSANKVLILN